MHHLDRRTFLRLLAGSSALFGLSALAACQPGGRAAATTNALAAPGSGLPPVDPLTHLLRRSRFATTAADLAAARNLGADAYLEQQLQMPDSTDPVYIEADARYPATLLMPPANSALGGSMETATAQLAERTLFLAAYSNAQLYEMTVDFWTNHFNVENVSGQLPLHKLYDDREVIRAHSFGRFGDLLQASAKSPAMLEYLDSVSNVADGPNENYARELMELHTLGVDGGYTEQDVREVARCFTGWSIDGSLMQFQFNAAQHDDGEKQVLGHTIPAGGGVTDGETVLRILAEHPSTARHVATRLALRFVSDQPAAGLIDRLAAEFTRSGGDTRALLRSLFTAPDFFAAQDHKFRRPLEFLAGLLRIFYADHLGFDGPAEITTLSRMGQIPHRWFPPDGYPDRSSYWLNTANLLECWNRAALIAENPDLLGRSPLDSVTAESLPGLVDELAERLVLRPLRPADRDLLANVAESALPGAGSPTPAQAALIAGLLLASPYFSLR